MFARKWLFARLACWAACMATRTGIRLGAPFNFLISLGQRAGERDVFLGDDVLVTLEKRVPPRNPDQQHKRRQNDAREHNRLDFGLRFSQPDVALEFRRFQMRDFQILPLEIELRNKDVLSGAQQRHLDEDREEERIEAELNGGRQALDDQVGHWLVRLERDAQIAAPHLREIADELLGDGLVQTKTNLARLDLGLRGALAQSVNTGVAGDDAGEQKHQENDAQQNGHA